jgi:hypothetical protein
MTPVSLGDVEWSPAGAGRCLVHWPGGNAVHAIGGDPGPADFVWQRRIALAEVWLRQTTIEAGTL